MVIDVFLYSFINGFKTNLLLFAECIIVIFFIVTFICVKYVSFSKSEEDL